MFLTNVHLLFIPLVSSLNLIAKETILKTQTYGFRTAVLSVDGDIVTVLVSVYVLWHQKGVGGQRVSGSAGPVNLGAHRVPGAGARLAPASSRGKK